MRFAQTAPEISHPGPGFGSELGQFVSQRAHLSGFDEILVESLFRHLGRRLVEVGCGSGTMTRLLADRELVIALDIDEANVRRVRERFCDRTNVICLQMDATDIGDRLGRYQLDSAICTNVLEHIADDDLALRQIAGALPVGGKFVIVVPSGRWLYGTLDVAVGHYRRYSQSELRSKIRAAGFVDREVFWFNALGTVGWFLNGRVLRRRTLTDWQLHLFDRFARPAMALESRFPLPIGLSLVAVCEKT